MCTASTQILLLVCTYGKKNSGLYQWKVKKRLRERSRVAAFFRTKVFQPNTVKDMHLFKAGWLTNKFFSLHFSSALAAARRTTQDVATITAIDFTYTQLTHTHRHTRIHKMNEKRKANCAKPIRKYSATNYTTHTQPTPELIWQNEFRNYLCISKLLFIIFLN